MDQERQSPQLVIVPQFGIHSRWLLPFPWQLPEGDARTLGFNFPGIPELGTAALDLRIKEDLAIYATHAELIAAAVLKPALAMMFYHTHVDANGKAAKRWLDLQHTQYDAIAGTPANPKYLKQPFYLAKGDTLTCEITNAVTTGAGGPFGNVHYIGVDFYVTLDGVAVDAPAEGAQ